MQVVVALWLGLLMGGVGASWLDLAANDPGYFVELLNHILDQNAHDLNIPPLTLKETSLDVQIEPTCSDFKLQIVPSLSTRTNPLDSLSAQADFAPRKHGHHQMVTRPNPKLRDSLKLDPMEIPLPEPAVPRDLLAYEDLETSFFDKLQVINVPQPTTEWTELDLNKIGSYKSIVPLIVCIDQIDHAPSQDLLRKLKGFLETSSNNLNTIYLRALRFLYNNCQLARRLLNRQTRAYQEADAVRQFRMSRLDPLRAALCCILGLKLKAIKREEYLLIEAIHDKVKELLN